MLNAKYIESWKNDVYNSPKCVYYLMFKTQHELESYLCKLPEIYVNCLVNYQMWNHVCQLKQVDGLVKRETYNNDPNGTP